MTCPTCGNEVVPMYFNRYCCQMCRKIDLTEFGKQQMEHILQELVDGAELFTGESNDDPNGTALWQEER